MDVPLGYCQCGCGEKTIINKRNNTLRKTVKGQPNRFVLSHWNRKERTPVIQPRDSDIRYIPLTHSQVAIVDIQDFERFVEHRWIAMWVRAKKKYYAVRYYTLADGTPRCSLMHREALNLDHSDPRIVDHVEPLLTLDNRHSNLRFATYSENSANQGLRKDNTSGYKGVTWSKYMNLWTTRITVRGEHIFLGYFRNPLDAYAAYCKAAIFHFGEFARLG